jgi:hypothetical protein
VFADISETIDAHMCSLDAVISLKAIEKGPYHYMSFNSMNLALKVGHSFFKLYSTDLDAVRSVYGTVLRYLILN